MKGLGKVLLAAAEQHPLAAIVCTAMIADMIVYNTCVLIDRCNQYKYLAKQQKEATKKEYYYED